MADGCSCACWCAQSSPHQGGWVLWKQLATPHSCQRSLLSRSRPRSTVWHKPGNRNMTLRKWNDVQKKKKKFTFPIHLLRFKFQQTSVTAYDSRQLSLSTVSDANYTITASGSQLNCLGPMETPSWRELMRGRVLTRKAGVTYTVNTALHLFHETVDVLLVKLRKWCRAVDHLHLLSRPVQGHGRLLKNLISGGLANIGDSKRYLYMALSVGRKLPACWHSILHLPGKVLDVQQTFFINRLKFIYELQIGPTIFQS